MSGKRYGYSRGKLILQPGSSVSEEQDYSLRGHAVFRGEALNLSTAPQRGDAHPKNKFLSCYATLTTWQDQGIVEVSADYIGLDQDPTPYFLEFVGSVGEEAIETHPNFAGYIGGTPAAPRNNAQYDSDGNFLGFPANAPFYLGGVRSYYRPSVIVRISYWQFDKPNPGLLGHVVELSQIDDLILPANCLDLLVTNFGYRTLTPKTPPYQITVEMLASGPLGWNQLIYPLS